jgi:hypothetical protein
LRLCAIFFLGGSRLRLCAFARSFSLVGLGLAKT